MSVALSTSSLTVRWMSKPIHASKTKPAVVTERPVMRMRIDISLLFDEHTPNNAPPLYDHGHMARINRAIAEELISMHAGTVMILPGGEWNFNIDKRKGKIDPSIGVGPYVVDPGRQMVPRSPQLTLDDTMEEAEANIDMVGLDHDTVSPLDVYVRRGPDGKPVMMALSLSGLLWLNDIMEGEPEGFEVVAVGSEWTIHGCSAKDMVKRLAATTLPPKSVGVTSLGTTGCTLTALTSAGVRWLRLCQFMGERMANPWTSK